MNWTELPYGETQWWDFVVLNLGTRWICVISFTARPFYPGESIPGMHWTGGWVGHKASLDTVAKRKNPVSAPRELNPGRPTSSLVCILIEMPRLQYEEQWQLRLPSSLLSNGYQGLFPGG
jgi:hypothetical protein